MKHARMTKRKQIMVEQKMMDVFLVVAGDILGANKGTIF